jgi:hypothetical protein
MVRKDIKNASIHTLSFRLTDKTILLFVRDYTHVLKDRMSPFLLVITNDLTIYKKEISKAFIDSDEFVLARSNSQNKVWLFSNNFKEWYEWDISTRQFNTFKNAKPSEKDFKVLISSSVPDKNE